MKLSLSSIDDLYKDLKRNKRRSCFRWPCDLRGGRTARLTQLCLARFPTGFQVVVLASEEKNLVNSSELRTGRTMREVDENGGNFGREMKGKERLKEEWGREIPTIGWKKGI